MSSSSNQKRTIVATIGTNWIWNNMLRPSLARLAKRFTSADQPSGVISIPLSPSESSISACQEPLQAETKLKVYVIGHGLAYFPYLVSVTRAYRVSPKAIAVSLSKVFNRLQVRDTPTKPITISLIACDAAVGGQQALATQLVRALHDLGYEHVVVKARRGVIFFPFFGYKFTLGTKFRFYSDSKEIFVVKSDHDLMYLTEHAFQKCLQRTPSSSKRNALSQALVRLSEIKAARREDQLEQVKQLVKVMSNDTLIKETSGWTRFFHLRSRTEACIINLQPKLHQAKFIFDQAKSFAYN